MHGPRWVPRAGRGAWRAIASVALLVLSAAALSGCIGGDAVADSYRDADERVSHSFTGGYTNTRDIEVPAGTSLLRVGVHYDTTGGLTVQLFGPSGQPKAELSQGGTQSGKDDEWFRETGPASGTWRLQVSAGGSGAVSVGVYVES